MVYNPVSSHAAVPTADPTNYIERNIVDSIDHIGIAVNSLAEAIPAFATLLGQNPSGNEEVPSEGVRVAFFGDGPGRLELLEPLGAESPVARFLDKHGPGVHHVCLTTPDLRVTLAEAQAAGMEILEPPIREGAHGTRVAFLHPRSTSGVLIELIERSG
jgi:methylmalonyl-CoA/ethylmalonyl-CoA epimerase